MTGVVVWLAGLPSSGKSTLARRLQRALAERGRSSVLLDGDDLRAAFVPTPGHTPRERDDFYETLARLSATLARQGLVVIVAATAHRQAYRDRVRALAPRLVEVYLSLPLRECEARDVKGLYALARAGGAPHLPGIGEPFEPPPAPDVVAQGGEDESALDAVVRLLGG